MIPEQMKFSTASGMIFRHNQIFDFLFYMLEHTQTKKIKKLVLELF